MEHHRASTASNSVCGCTEATSGPSVFSSMSSVFFAKLQEVWVVTNRRILGPSGYHECVQSIRVLGKIVEWTDDGITWEGDPQHSELIRKSFGVTSRSLATPGVRDKLDDSEREVPIGKEAADRHRARTTRAQKISSDRLEIQVECQDLAHLMQCRIWMKCELPRLVGCPSGKSVSHAQNPGAIRTMLAVSEPGRVSLVVR